MQRIGPESFSHTRPVSSIRSTAFTAGWFRTELPIPPRQQPFRAGQRNLAAGPRNRLTVDLAQDGIHQTGGRALAGALEAATNLRAAKSCGCTKTERWIKYRLKVRPAHA